MVANSAITTHRGPPPAPLQRGIITEIDNVKKFLSETFGKHATPSDVKGQTEDCVKWKVGGGDTELFRILRGNGGKFQWEQDFMNVNWVIYFSHSLTVSI